MKRHSEFIDRLFAHDDLLRKLQPSEPAHVPLLQRLRAADEATLLGGREPADSAMVALVRGGLLYALDSLAEAHVVFQETPGDLGAYWHGMVHRREGDFDNARYWFRRAGALPVFAEMHRAAGEVSADMARQTMWDPYLFTGQCEQCRFGASELERELSALQRIEFDALFDYCWRGAVGG